MIESCAALGVGCGRSPDLAVSAALSRGGVRLLLAALHFSEFGPFPPLPTEEALAQGRSRAQLSDVAAAAIVPLLKGAGATEIEADISGAKAVVAQLRSGYGIEACCSVLSRSLYSLSTPKSFPGTVVSSAQYSQPRSQEPIPGGALDLLAYMICGPSAEDVAKRAVAIPTVRAVADGVVVPGPTTEAGVKWGGGLMPLLSSILRRLGRPKPPAANGDDGENRDVEHDQLDGEDGNPDFQAALPIVLPTLELILGILRLLPDAHGASVVLVPQGHEPRCSPALQLMAAGGGAGFSVLKPLVAMLKWPDGTARRRSCAILLCLAAQSMLVAERLTRTRALKPVSSILVEFPDDPDICAYAKQAARALATARARDGIGDAGRLAKDVENFTLAKHRGLGGGQAQGQSQGQGDGWEAESPKSPRHEGGGGDGGGGSGTISPRCQQQARSIPDPNDYTYANPVELVRRKHREAQEAARAMYARQHAHLAHSQSYPEMSATDASARVQLQGPGQRRARPGSASARPRSAGQTRTRPGSAPMGGRRKEAGVRTGPLFFGRDISTSARRAAQRTAAAVAAAKAANLDAGAPQPKRVPAPVAFGTCVKNQVDEEPAVGKRRTKGRGRRKKRRAKGTEATAARETPGAHEGGGHEVARAQKYALEVALQGLAKKLFDAGLGAPSGRPSNEAIKEAIEEAAREAGDEGLAGGGLGGQLTFRDQLEVMVRSLEGSAVAMQETMQEARVAPVPSVRKEGPVVFAGEDEADEAFLVDQSLLEEERALGIDHGDGGDWHRGTASRQMT
mmetsp:Transcript_1077/g.2161  ORF Transcript_1077/g.2161 Transcript_1077/m.2161 type:complete len:794 (-) Transcript_1077:34-2415(-)